MSEYCCIACDVDNDKNHSVANPLTRGSFRFLRQLTDFFARRAGSSAIDSNYSGGKA